LSSERSWSPHLKAGLCVLVVAIFFKNYRCSTSSKVEFKKIIIDFETSYCRITILFKSDRLRRESVNKCLVTVDGYRVFFYFTIKYSLFGFCSASWHCVCSVFFHITKLYIYDTTVSCIVFLLLYIH
jgi:hypothetical protein